MNASAQSRQNLRCSFIQAVSQEEPSDRKPDPWPLWMAGHAQLKFVMTECSKTQIRLTGLILQLSETTFRHTYTSILNETYWYCDARQFFYCQPISINYCFTNMELRFAYTILEPTSLTLFYSFKVPENMYQKQCNVFWKAFGLCGGDYDSKMTSMSTNTTRVP